MSTTTRKIQKSVWLAVGSIGLAAGCAGTTQRNAYDLSYDGEPLGFGTTPTAVDLAGKFSYPADGRGLPPGSGSYGEGIKVYEAKCLACHGAKLQGVSGLGEALIGGRGMLGTNEPKKAPLKTVESYWPYATTVFDFVKRAMPFNAPGSLTDNEVYAVAAYILGEANIIKKNEMLNAQTLPQVRMPNRDGFVPDPRPDVR